MKQKIFIFLITVFFLYTCSESNNSVILCFNDVIGCYNYDIRKNNEFICILKDYTYFHCIYDENDNIIFSERENLQYNRVVKLNLLILLNFSHIEDDVNYKTDAYFYVSKRWGQTTISHSFNADPDGTPIIPRYKKIPIKKTRQILRWIEQIDVNRLK